MENSLPPPLIPDDIKEAIYALFDECLNTHTPFHRKLDIFVIPDALAQRVQEATGIDVFGHLVCIDNFGIPHTLEQHYVQNKSQQVVLPLADFKTPMNHNARSILFDTSETFGWGLQTGRNTY